MSKNLLKLFIVLFLGLTVGLSCNKTGQDELLPEEDKKKLSKLQKLKIGSPVMQV